jgi:hypothetical protein
MMNIEPNYCSFEQCKSLKEKGFDIPTIHWYHRETKKFNTNALLFSMNKLTDNYAAPEQWQVVEWFFEKYNINIQPYQITNDSEYYPDFFSEINNKGEIIEIGWSKTREEAISKAIDYTLKKLI